LIEKRFEPVGLYPYKPQKAAGIRIDPPESDPRPKTEAFVETWTAYPPEDPPLINLLLNGFKDVP